LFSSEELLIANKINQGTYKPQMHAHYLPHLSLSFARHTDCLNQTFILLSSDYSKSLHLQVDRSLEFHTPGGCHYKTRIPRYGRDLIYDRRSAEALIPAVGVNEEGTGEVFRLNLELGRFMKGYEVDVGGDDTSKLDGGSLQGGIHTGSVNAAAIAEESHNLLAFGTSIGTVEFWDPRSKGRVGVVSMPQNQTFEGAGHSEVTALQFHRSGLTFASGSSDGLIHLYDLRSPLPLLKKDQGYGYPIQDLIFLDSTLTSRLQTAEPKILSADKRIIKIWNPSDGTPWTSVEPAVDLNHVEWCKDSGMILTANEGKQQHAFFIPQLGPAPKWCAFLDNLVEEMAEDPNDPAAFNNARKSGEVYDNYKFLTPQQLRQLNMDHLVGKTGLLRPYMHGFFVSQKLYEEALLINNPELWQEQRAKSIKQKIDKERESRIRGNKKVQVKVNRKLAEKMQEREEKNERRKAKRILARGGDEDMVDVEPEVEEKDTEKPQRPGLLTDERFARLFQDEEFEIDEQSKEFKMINPSTKVDPTERKAIPKGLTAAEIEEYDDQNARSSEDDDDDASDDDPGFDARQLGQRKRNNLQKEKRKDAPVSKPAAPKMLVSSSSTAKKPQSSKDKSFGARAAVLKEKKRDTAGAVRSAVGEKEISFFPEKKSKRLERGEKTDGKGEGRSGNRKSFKDRRSASGNTFRGM
jgi:ribosome biogenesis protein ENP2